MKMVKILEQTTLTLFRQRRQNNTRKFARYNIQPNHQSSILYQNKHWFLGLIFQHSNIFEYTTISFTLWALHWDGTQSSDQEFCQPATYSCKTLLSFCRSIYVGLKKHLMERTETCDQYEIQILRISWVTRGSDRASTHLQINLSCLQ